jgi:hypothetical protein
MKARTSMMMDRSLGKIPMMSLRRLISLLRRLSGLVLAVWASSRAGLHQPLLSFWISHWLL